MTIYASATSGSSRGQTSATLSSMPGALRASLQMTEVQTRRLRPTFHRKAIGSREKQIENNKNLSKTTDRGLAGLSLG